MASAGLGSAQAMGVGRPQTLSALGQPLSLLFPVQLSAGETLSQDCVRAEVVAGESRLPPNLLQIQLEGESESSVRAVRLRSAVQVDEPLVSVQLSLGCPVRLTRQYTAFIDPPGAAQAAQSVPRSDGSGEPAVVQNYSAALRAALATADAKPAELLAGRAAPERVALAVVDSTGSSPSAASSAASMPASKASAPSPASRPVASKPSPAEGAGKSASTSPSAKPSGKATPERASAPKLQMEPAELLVAALAASAPAPQDEEARQRLARLEQSLAQMQAQQRESEARIASLQAQLAQAQSASSDRPLVLGLSVLSLALLGFAAWLWHSRGRSTPASSSSWLQEVREPDEPPPSPPPSPPPQPLVEVAPAPAPTPHSPTATHVSALLDAGRPESFTGGGLAALSKAAAASMPPEPPAAAEVSVRSALEPEPGLTVQPIEVSAAQEPVSFELVERDAPQAASTALPTLAVEALIDLDQQVDFFQVLGQDEAAIDLLRSHLDGGAPLPHLLLLALYRRRGDLDLLAALESDYAQRFGASAPQQLGTAAAGLEEHPILLARLQACWKDHGASMSLLQSLLGAAGGQQGLDLDSCRELLLLYGVARDLSEHEVRSADIDLFLPLDSPASDMMATMVWQTARTPALPSAAAEVDIPLGEDETPTIRPSLPG